MFEKSVKHRANDASNDGHRPPLVLNQREGEAIIYIKRDGFQELKSEMAGIAMSSFHTGEEVDESSSIEAEELRTFRS